MLPIFCGFTSDIGVSAFVTSMEISHIYFPWHGNSPRGAITIAFQALELLQCQWSVSHTSIDMVTAPEESLQCQCKCLSGYDVSGSAVLMPVQNGCAKFHNCDERRGLFLAYYFGYST